MFEKFPNDYYVEELDVKDDSWKQFDFSKFDVVYHVAGIAHMKEIKENEQLYYKINSDLAIYVATKLKKRRNPTIYVYEFNECPRIKINKRIVR